MKIQANAVTKLQELFSNIKWSKNCKTLPNPISVELLEDFFRTIGAGELSTISLFTFKEDIYAVVGYEGGHTIIEMELFAREYDDFFKFSYRYFSDPVRMSEKEELEINFSGIKHFRHVLYDFEKKSWVLKG